MRITLLLFVLLILLSAGCVRTKSPVCNKPYILVGRECCLDRDDNLICDIDETTTTTVALTTSSTTTTTASSTTASTTSTSSTMATTSTTASTTSSTTTTTLKRLPVAEKDYIAYLKASLEYQNLERKYDSGDIELGYGSRPSVDAKRTIENLEERYSVDCIDCIEFSGGLVWGAEFGTKEDAYMNNMDSETGTAAMYYKNGRTGKVSCWCDSI